MRIRITDVSELVKEKSFFHVTVKYNDLSKDKVFSRKFVSFAKPPYDAAYEAMKKAKVDDLYEVKLVKDETGNWQWGDVNKVEASTGESMKASSGTEQKTASTGSTWETGEERQRRQVLIVRQSCLAQAVSVKGMGEENTDNITELAEKFEEWVMRA